MEKNTNFKDELASLKLLVFDVDGVFTDGSILLLENGDQVRTFNIKDGFMVQQAIKKGLHLAVITGARSQAVKGRLEYLGIKDIYLGVQDKLDAYNELLAIHHYAQSEVLFMGDDMPDYDIMKRTGIPVCPADAVPEIREISRYISPFSGGKGCVRDIVGQVLRAKQLITHT
jgi:3-deoxy-D-manno-octulosonate 8-phosphate phosphatase (KDO 8-P phosphatase)